MQNGIFNGTVTKVHIDTDSFSVEITDKKIDMTLTVDVFIDEKYKDVDTMWNTYIFSTTNSKDILQSTLQDNDDVWEDSSSLAIEHLENLGYIKQDEKGNWLRLKQKDDMLN